MVFAVKGGYRLDRTLSFKFLDMVLLMAAEIERILKSQWTKEALARRKAEVSDSVEGTSRCHPPHRLCTEKYPRLHSGAENIENIVANQYWFIHAAAIKEKKQKPTLKTSQDDLT